MRQPRIKGRSLAPSGDAALSLRSLGTTTHCIWAGRRVVIPRPAPWPAASPKGRDLALEIHNKTSRDITIDSICISIKNNYLLFSTSSDELKQSKSYLIRSNSKFDFKLDVRHLFERYSTSKKFKVKVTVVE